METLESIDDSGSGSGSGDGEMIIFPKTNNVKLPTMTTTERSETKSAENDTARVTTPAVTIEEEVIKTETAHETMAYRPTSPEADEVEITEKNVSTATTPTTTTPTTTTPTISTTTSTASTTTTITTTTTTAVATSTTNNTPTTEGSTTAVRVLPPIPTVVVAGGDSNNSSTAPSSMDRVVIVSQTIQAPDDGGTGARGDDVQAKVANYLKSNVGVTVTAAVLAVVIIAIVYKATCADKSRSHSIRRAADGDDNGKIVELKDVKYVPANTDDSPSGGGSAQENLLEDHSDDDDDDDGDIDDEDGTTPSPSPPTPVTNDNARDRYDLLNSVMRTMDNGIKSPVAAASNGALHQDPQQQQVPTRVIVKLCETPKASRPITIDNVH